MTPEKANELARSIGEETAAYLESGNEHHFQKVKVLTDELLAVEFEGWSNQETFTIAYYLNNDQLAMNTLHVLTTDKLDFGGDQVSDLDRADALEAYIEQLVDVDDAGSKFLMETMLRIAIGKVDWLDIIKTCRKELGLS